MSAEPMSSHCLALSSHERGRGPGFGAAQTRGEPRGAGRAMRLAAVAGLVAAGLGLAGCSENYLDRFDGVTPSLGNAVASNRIAQTVDPWPAAAANTQVTMSGERAAVAMEKYRKQPLLPPVPSSGSSSGGSAAASGGPTLVSSSQ